MSLETVVGEFVKPLNKSKATVSKDEFGIYHIDFTYVDKRRISRIFLGVENGIVNQIESYIKEEYETLNYSFKRPDPESKNLSAVLTTKFPGESHLKIEPMMLKRRTELKITSDNNSKVVEDIRKNVLDRLIGEYKIALVTKDFKEKVYKLVKVGEEGINYLVVN